MRDDYKELGKVALDLARIPAMMPDVNLASMQELIKKYTDNYDLLSFALTLVANDVVEEYNFTYHSLVIYDLNYYYNVFA